MSENAAPQESGKTFWQRFFTDRFEVEQRGLMGTVIFFAIILAIAWIGVNEPQRMANFTTQYEARQVMRGAELFRDNCTGCHGVDGKGLPGVGPALNDVALYNGTRLEEVSWAGTLEDYMELTVAAGRPVMTEGWAQPMPTWGQAYGGPMREDQVADIVAYLMNWELQFADGYVEPVVEAPEATAEPVDAMQPIGTDMAVELPEGDPVRGEALFLGTESGPDGAILACQGCHSVEGQAGAGPAVNGLTGRLPDSYDSVSAYIHESIVMPCNFEQEGFACAIMPANFGERLDAQSLADIIAYLETVE